MTFCIFSFGGRGKTRVLMFVSRLDYLFVGWEGVLAVVFLGFILGKEEGGKEGRGKQGSL